MIPVLLAVVPQLWHALPLMVTVSLVYAATRHELMEPILRHATRFFCQVTLFLAVVFGVLLFMSASL